MGKWSYVSVIFLLLVQFCASSQPIWEVAISRNDQFTFDLECRGAVCIATLAEGLFLTTYVLRSTDYGKTWTRVHEEVPGESRSIPLRGEDVTFVSDQEILIAADSSYVLRSSDAGETWTEYEVGPTRWGDAGLLAMADDRNGIMTAQRYLFWFSPTPDRLFRTSDGGYTWDTVRTQPRDWPRIEHREMIAIASPAVDQYLILYTRPFPTETEYDSVMVFAYTRDGGQTWSYHDLKVEGVPWIRSPSLTFFDDRNGILTGVTSAGRGTGIVAVTGDGGRTWEVRAKGLDSTGRSNGILQSRFFTPEKGYAAHAGGIARTDDGGRTWQRDSVPPLPGIGRQIIRAVHMWDDSTGVAMTDAGGFYYLSRDRTEVAEDRRRLLSSASAVWRRDRGVEAITVETAVSGEAKVHLHDVVGRSALEMRQMLSRGSGEISIPVRDLTPGLYILRIDYSDGRVADYRIIVQ